MSTICQLKILKQVTTRGDGYVKKKQQGQWMKSLTKLESQHGNGH